MGKLRHGKGGVGFLSAEQRVGDRAQARPREVEALCEPVLAQALPDGPQAPGQDVP